MAPRFARRGALQELGERLAMEDVVAEDQRDAILADELAPDEESLRDAFRLGLHRVFEPQAPALAVAEQRLEARRVLRVEISRMSRMPASISVDSG